MKWHDPNSTKLLSLDEDMNVTVSIDNVVVQPGDIIIGDNGGLLVIPLEEYESYQKIGPEELKADAGRKDSLKNGTLESYFDNFLAHFEKL